MLSNLLVMIEKQFIYFFLNNFFSLLILFSISLVPQICSPISSIVCLEE